ncbi:MAG TPA: serine/threonine protein phosphatase, partial [Candidatus Accumulibacter sp.]|nr:serine/threonine protein phosphatase [Accumulibacter sp.]
MGISVDACVAQHQGDRREQQDRAVIVPHPRGGGVVLAVVADGMGGHTGG